MLDIDKINDEIECLEECGCTSYDVCERLAILYTVRDHMKVNAGTDMRSQTQAPANKMI